MPSLWTRANMDYVITLLNELALVQYITCVQALWVICRHPSSSLTTTIISWNMQTAGSYKNVTAGHWYNCILARSYVLLSFDGIVLVFPLHSTPGGIWSEHRSLQLEDEERQQQSEVIHHKHDTFGFDVI